MMARPPFTDTHVHFFDLRQSNLRYSWLRHGGDPDEAGVLGDYAAIRAERYWADDFVAETRFQGVERVVHVQAALGIEDPVEETHWLAEFQRRLGVPHAVVAAADLAARDVAETLDRQLEYQIVRGIRDLRYDDYLTDPAWQRGFGLLGERGLVCCDDPLLEHIDDAIVLFGRHPETTVCIDHALMPRQRDDAYHAHWRRQLARLSELPNTMIKISGLGQVDHRWTVATLRPWVLSCIEEFGVERSFFGTNWPVDRLYSSYGDVLDAYAEIISDFTELEQHALFTDNARRVFRIDSEESGD